MKSCLCMTRDLRRVRTDQLSPAGLGPAAALTEKGLNIPPPLKVPGASEGKSILDISLQNTFLPCLTVSFTGLLQHWGPYLLDAPESQSKDNMYWYSNNMTDFFKEK